MLDGENRYLREAVSGFTQRTAMEEAARCLLCYDAPCSQSCPAGTNPAKFIRSIRFRNIKGAANTIRENNALGASCARICPYDRLCEGACSRCGIDRPIQIGRLQRFAMEEEKRYGMQTLKPGAEKKEKVACIGAGPASLTVAAELRKIGYGVTVYDANARAGGYLSYGITEARLPQAVVDYDIEKLKELGVGFVMNTRIGVQISFDTLYQEYDAVFLGIGLWKAKLPGIPGAELPGVVSGIEFLRNARESAGTAPIGKQILVIGGGNVAMDCASAAKLMGAEKVSVWYRRTLEEAPADRADMAYVMGLGVPVTTDMAPIRIEGSTCAEAVCFQGRDGKSMARIACDTVIFAIGQEAEIPRIDGLRKTEKGLIFSEDSATNLPGVFTAGDAAHGGKTAVAAVGAAKAAARQIDAYLTGKRRDG